MIHCVCLLTALCHILRGTTVLAFSIRRSTPKLIENSRMSTSYRSSNVAKGKPLAMQRLHHATFFQRKVAVGDTYVLPCVRMDVVHSDCSFVDDFSQNHFNMKLHYGFLFFDYLFKFILQLIVTKKEKRYNEKL